MRYIPLTLFVLLLVKISIAQSGSSGYVVSRPMSIAHFTSTPPVIDGEILSDPVWSGVSPITDFIQTQPHLGQPISEKTEIRIAYDKEYFYLSVFCYDKTPEKIIISDSRRDASLDATDAFLFILDTYKDGQNGFVFGTNPAGIEYDAQVDNEGQGNINSNRQAGGRIGGVNLNWDASWTVKTKINDLGWTAEFAIPFRTLRYNSGNDQSWGVNFQRNIQKNNEAAYWSPIPVEFNIYRLSLEGTLAGLNLQSPGNLKIIPYVLGNIKTDNLVTPAHSTQKANFGGDIKYSITPSLTLDLTYNTDFAQVEVDDQQVNLDRFNLFFPEKRPFFLENAGQFGVGSPGEVDLFFSRRIGIGNDGTIVPILGGARLSGKIHNTNIGLLSMFTDDVESSGIVKTNYSIARVSHELAKRSRIGAAFINKENLGLHEDHYNRVFALDGKWGIGNKATLSGFLAKSSTPDISSNDHSFLLNYNYEWKKLNMVVGYSELGNGFNPEVGFLLRNSFRKPEALVLYHLRMNGKAGLLELRPHVSYRSYWNYTNHKLETSFLHIDNHWEWQNGFEVHTGINFTTEGVFTPFEISSKIFVPAGTYNHREGQFVIMSNTSKNISFNLREVIGGFFGGKRISTTAGINVRLGDKFTSEWGVNNNLVKLPSGDFNTNILRSRISYSFTPRIYIQSLTQFNSVLDKWSINLRLGWLRQSNTGLFLVFNENRGLDRFENRSFTIKYSRLFDVIK
ncbi:MAG: DUF5916 domain-containing protein [Saprospiraceae bacterium]